MKKNKAPHFEMNFGAEGFALVPEETIDWSAREAEAKRKVEDRKISEARQASLLPGAETQPGLHGTWHLHR